MSDSPSPSHILTGDQMPNLTGSPTFLFVIDGEIADIQVIKEHPQMERRIAVLSSDPKIYVLDGGFPADGIVPQIGSQWPMPSNLDVSSPTE
jgi:hypothetical protein